MVLVGIIKNLREVSQMIHLIFIITGGIQLQTVPRENIVTSLIAAVMNQQ
jgi:hypothetical protein